MDFSGLETFVDEGSLDASLYEKPSEGELRESLTAEQFDVTQNAATEQPFSGAYLGHVFTDEPAAEGGCAAASTARRCSSSPSRTWTPKATTI